MAAGQVVGRWSERPVLSRLLRIAATLVPLLLGLAVAFGLSLALPPPDGFAAGVWRWIVLSSAATVVVIVVDRYARRLLPIAALLQLNLAFPGAAPSRYRVARESASTRGLADEVRRAREHGLSDDRTDAAASVLRLVSALSLHDKATRGHAERTRVLTDMIAAELELPQDDVDRLRWAALIHDVGKVTVHPQLLNKAGEPTEDEWEILRRHPEEGARLTAPLREWLGEWALTIEQHHERWDGSGYPQGLAGREIHLGARIVAVADAFDVMTASRAYRDAVPAHVAREELAACAGGQFDPVVVRAFLAIPLGNLRGVVGPLSWLATLPMVRPLTRVPSSAGASVAVAVATAGVVAAAGMALPPPEEQPVLAIQDQAETAVDEPLPAPRPFIEPETRVLGTQESRGPEPAPTPAPLPERVPTASPDILIPPRTPTPPPSPLTGPVTVTENPTVGPPAPVAVAPVATDDTVEVDEGDSVTVDVLANDSDPQGDPLRLLAVDRTGTARGDFTDNGDGTITYVPYADAAGVEELAYRVTDGRFTDLAVVRFVIRSAAAGPPDDTNDAPVAGTDRYEVVAGDELVIAAGDGLLANDVDADGDDLAIVADSATGLSPDEGTVTIAADGSFRFVPAEGFDGLASFGYRVTDGTTTSSGAVQVRVVLPAGPDWRTQGLFMTPEVRDTTTSLLSATAPAAVSGVPDWDSDGAPGRTIRSSVLDEDESDPTLVHDWLFTLDADVQLDGAVELDLTSAVADLRGGETVRYSVYVHRCDADGKDCTRLVDSRNMRAADWNAEGAWSTRTLRIGDSNRALLAGSTVRVRLLFKDADIWLPLTSDLPSTLRFTVED